MPRVCAISRLAQANSHRCKRNPKIVRWGRLIYLRGLAGDTETPLKPSKLRPRASPFSFRAFASAP